MSSVRDKGVELFSSISPKQLKLWLMLTELQKMLPDSKCPICKERPISNCDCANHKAQELMEAVFIDSITDEVVVTKSCSRSASLTSLHDTIDSHDYTQSLTNAYKHS